MDMWKPQAVPQALPEAALAFDRCHVMPRYSKAIDRARRSGFKSASTADRNVRAGSRYRLLKNAERLSESQAGRLDELLAAHGPLNAVYALKEQLQQL